MYADAGSQVESEQHLNITEFLWTSPHVTQSSLRSVLKAHYGQLWIVDTTYGRKMPYSMGVKI